jgi:WD40 repeat protein
MSPSGVACAGSWNALYSICSPNNYGTAEVTASALGATSPPTLVFVHPPIDNIQISLVPPLNSPPPACPAQTALPAACDIAFNANPYCLSQNQVETLQAKAYSQGIDYTAAVGPFGWLEANAGVAGLAPIITSSTNIATNQVTVTPTIPGQTEIFASAGGVSSQPYNFETCPVQCITLAAGTSGSQQTGQTSFEVSKGTAEVITATAVDVQGCVLAKPPLTWSSSQPGAISSGPATGCAAGTACSVSASQPGAASVTAACTPPTCNVGFPLNPAGYPALYVPTPVYPVTAISGLVTGAPVSTSVLATSLDCSSNAFCNVSLYDISTAKNLAGTATTLPVPPNSMMFDPAGDKVYMGSQFGAAVINPANLGTTSNPFTALPTPATPTGLVTGKILAVSSNGNVAVFSDTLSTPNRVYVVNTTQSASPVTTPLYISGAVAAAFSPDGLKTLIIGCITGPVLCTTASGNTLYVYSTLQALTPIPLSAPASAIAFSSSGAFALVTGGSPSAPYAITVNTCDNSSNPLSVAALPGPPTFLRTVPAADFPLGNAILPSLTSSGLDVFVGIDSTGIDVIATNAAQGPFTSVCPQSVTLATVENTSTVFQPVHLPLQQGALNLIDFFVAPDGTQIYIVATNRNSVLIYSFNTGSVSTITLSSSVTGQAVTPVSAGMTVDGTLLYVATTDGELHQLSTLSLADLLQIPFPPVVNSTNGFCFYGASAVPCGLDLTIVRP